MIYKYNAQTLSYEKINKKSFVWLIGVLFFCGLMFSLFLIRSFSKTILASEEIKTIILGQAKEANQFSKDNLKAYILELNIRFPHIVLAQAQLETGNFKSLIFEENHNLFGMKCATRRPTTNKGEENGHAYFENWKDCVVDYAFFSAQYLSKIKTEDEYFEYLKQNYAQDSTYVSKLKEIISQNEK